MSAMGIIFANIYDSSMGDLTNKRTMASLPFGGRYRQIDFTLSNMSNSGIRRIGIISRHNYQSLMNHIGSGSEWNLELEEGGLEFMTPYALGTSVSEFRGKLDVLNSVREYLEYGAKDDYVILSDSSVLCNMDLNKILEAHIASGKDVTIVAAKGIANGKKQLSMAFRTDDAGQLTDVAVDYVAPEGYLASTGIFIVAKDLLMHHVKEAVARSLYRFERDFLLRQYQAGNLSLHVYRYEGVTLFNDSTEEYFASNFAILDEKIRKDLFNPDRPIYTRVRDQVPTYYCDGSNIEYCSVADGCMLDGHVKNSVLFRHVTIGAGCEIEGCLIMNDTVVGENCELKYVILDKDVVVRPGSKLMGTVTNPLIIKRGDKV